MRKIYYGIKVINIGKLKTENRLQSFQTISEKCLMVWEFLKKLQKKLFLKIESKVESYFEYKATTMNKIDHEIK